MTINTINQKKNNICQNLTENVEDRQTDNTKNHAGSVGSIIGKKGNKVWQLQTKNNLSITKTKQAEYNQKLTIERSIPNIQTTIDEIKQTTQCKCSKACAFGLILNLTMDILTS